MQGPSASIAGAMDRIAPTRRPDDRIVMYQNWADLLFLHWEIPPGMLRPLIPADLEIDTFQGRAYVGLVPFTMHGVRPIWSPSIPPLSDFHETNVRTYVHFKGRDPGVWFLSLDAANAIAVRIARAAWKLPYHFARMRLKKTESPDRRSRSAATNGLHSGTDNGEPARFSVRENSQASPAIEIEYSTERLWPGPTPGFCRVRYGVMGPVKPAVPDTLEYFLAERYLLYAGTAGRLYRGQVHHTPYPLQTAAVYTLEENLVAAAGIVRPDAAPLAHYASGVTVDIYGLHRL